jgi:PAS domain S-box-containing protein
VSYVAKQTDTQEGNASAVATEHQPRTERFFELSLVRAEDNVRMALLILLLIVALTSPTYVVSSVTLYTSLVIGVLLTLWTRFAARWGELRAAGHMATASGIVLLAEFAWLALFVHGTGGLTSPFSALLLLPVIFASAFFSLLHIAVALTTGLIVATNVFFAVRYRLDPDTSWHLTGMLLAVIAIAWASYGLCLVLERERRANDLVVRHLSEGVILIDSLGWIRLVNEQLERFTGVPAQAVLPLNTLHVAKTPELSALAEILRDVMAPETYDPTDVRDITINRPEPIDLRVITMRLGGSADRPTGWLVICQDITELKSLVRMREDGIRFLSHEMRSPLTTFKMISSIFSELANQLSDNSSAKLIEIVDHETDRMLRLVGQFLDIAALDEGSFRLNVGEVNVPELVQKAAEPLEIRATAKDISVSSQCAEQIPVIPGDPERLEDALHNLCDNALKYSEPGGHISITAETSDGHVRIAISDTGRGISPEMQEAIFEQFVQAHADEAEATTLERGSGLGLYMVRRIVELHGGRIEVDSEVGRGSTFTIHLPISGAGPRAE